MQIFFSIFWWIYFCVFFSGYPLIYGFLYFTGKRKSMHGSIAEKISPILPLSYAFVATCFWILMICTGKMNFVFDKIASVAPAALAIIYSLTALLFWLPLFRKKKYLSLLHSLPLFLLPPLNMLFKVLRHTVVVYDYISTLFRIYIAAFILYIMAITFLLLIKWVAGLFLFKHQKA